MASKVKQPVRGDVIENAAGFRYRVMDPTRRTMTPLDDPGAYDTTYDPALLERKGRGWQEVLTPAMQMAKGRADLTILVAAEVRNVVLAQDVYPSMGAMTVRDSLGEVWEITIQKSDAKKLACEMDLERQLAPALSAPSPAAGGGAARSGRSPRPASRRRTK